LNELERLKEFLALISVAHHIPGRARLKLSGELPSWLLASPIGERFKAIKGVTNVSVNPFSMSAVVNYDQNELPPSLFEALGRGDCEPILERVRSAL
jgi:hypothetical protein